MSETRRITYPISPDYVQGSWTVERALAEIVANALDEDPRPTISCAGDSFVVEDAGDGLRSRDLVLGVSRKSNSQIGQFGEGLKVGSLVLARNARIKDVTIETVGFTLHPLISRDAFDALGADEAVELLAFDIVPNTRKTGTKVTVQGVKKELADKVTARFRQLQEPDYEPPGEDGCVLIDQPGKVYILGVFVQERKDLLFGYDLPDKRMQNRDRNVVDGYALRRAIGGVLRSTTDLAVIERLVEACFDGTISGEEKMFIFNRDPEVQKFIRSLGEKRFAGKQVCWQDPYDRDDETLLDLADRGYELVELDKLDANESRLLLDALGVPKVKALKRRPPQNQVTEWLSEKELSDDERQTLSTAAALVQRFYGGEAVGEVKAYISTRYENADEELWWGGFYDPRSGRIGLQRKNLTSLQATLEVLIHEAAHRILHRSRRTHQDRTREFERQLGDMAASLALKLHALGALDGGLDEALGQAEPSRAERHAATPAGEARKLIAAAMDERKLKAPKLAAEVRLSVDRIRKLRANSMNAVWSVPSVEELQPITTKLGLDTETIWLCLFSSKLPSVTRNNKGRLFGNGRVADFEACIDTVSARGGEWVQVAEELRGQLNGTVETLSANVPASANKWAQRSAVPRGDEEWLAPYRKLLAAEIARVGKGQEELASG